MENQVHMHWFWLGLPTARPVGQTSPHAFLTDWIFFPFKYFWFRYIGKSTSMAELDSKVFILLKIGRNSNTNLFSLTYMRQFFGHLIVVDLFVLTSVKVVYFLPLFKSFWGISTNFTYPHFLKKNTNTLNRDCLYWRLLDSSLGITISLESIRKLKTHLYLLD